MENVICNCQITALGRVDNPSCPECHPVLVLVPSGDALGAMKDGMHRIEVSGTNEAVWEEERYLNLTLRLGPPDGDHGVPTIVDDSGEDNPNLDHIDKLSKVTTFADVQEYVNQVVLSDPQLDEYVKMEAAVKNYMAGLGYEFNMQWTSFKKDGRVVHWTGAMRMLILHLLDQLQSLQKPGNPCDTTIVVEPGKVYNCSMRGVFNMPEHVRLEPWWNDNAERDAKTETLYGGRATKEEARSTDEDEDD